MDWSDHLPPRPGWLSMSFLFLLSGLVLSLAAVVRAGQCVLVFLRGLISDVCYVSVCSRPVLCFLSALNSFHFAFCKAQRAFFVFLNTGGAWSATLVVVEFHYVFSVCQRWVCRC